MNVIPSTGGRPPLDVNSERIFVTESLEHFRGKDMPPELIEDDFLFPVVPLPESIVPIEIVGPLFMGTVGFSGSYEKKIRPPSIERRMKKSYRGDHSGG